MEQPTFEEVKSWNLGYNSQHFFSQGDYELCLKIKKVIEEGRNPKRPMPGDIVVYTCAFGHHYKNAHIEGLNHFKDCNDTFSICEQPYVPFAYISKETGEISMNTSGGAWTSAHKKDLKLIGTREKAFKDWGHCGACGGGAVTTIATVNVWRLNRRAKELRKYTEKTHKMMIVSDRGGPDPERMNYRFFGDGAAWKTQEELDEFLKRYHAYQELQYDVWPNSKKYWLFKKQYHWIYSRKQFELIKAKEEIEYMNGERPAKFIAKGTTLHCYVDRSDEVANGKR